MLNQIMPKHRITFKLTILKEKKHFLAGKDFIANSKRYITTA